MRMSVSTICHAVVEMVNQGLLPLGIVPLIAPFTKTGKFATRYYADEQDKNLPSEDEDSEDSGYEQDRVLEEAEAEIEKMSE